jgi:methyl coenzyme M reductase gamma subunit
LEKEITNINIVIERKNYMKKEYEAPKVITYSEDEIIELLGPAQTCSPSPCPTYQ